MDLSSISMLLRDGQIKDLDNFILDGSGLGLQETTIEEVIHASIPVDNTKLYGELLHITKPKKERKLQLRKQLGEKVREFQKAYHRMVFFTTGTSDNVSVVLLQSNPKDRLAVSFWNDWRMGGPVFITNPEYDGEWNGCHIITTDCIYPLRNIQRWQKLRPVPPLGIPSTESFYSFCFDIKEIQITKVTFATCCANDCCDGRYKQDCWCLKKKPPLQLFGIQFTSPEQMGLTFPPFFSKKLVQTIMPEMYLTGQKKANPILLSNFVKRSLNNYNGGFRVSIWSKPSVKGDEEVATFSVAHVSELRLVSNVPLDMYSEVIERRSQQVTFNAASTQEDLEGTEEEGCGIKRKRGNHTSHHLQSTSADVFNRRKEPNPPAPGNSRKPPATKEDLAYQGIADDSVAQSEVQEIPDDINNDREHGERNLHLPPLKNIDEQFSQVLRDLQMAAELRGEEENIEEPFERDDIDGKEGAETEDVTSNKTT